MSPQTSSDHATRALHLAASHGDERRVIEALALGANANEPMLPKLQTALMIAAMRGHPEIVRILLPHSDARLTSENGHTALMLCALAPGDKALASASLLLPHSDPRRVDKDGRDALMSMAACGKADCCALLAPLVDPARVDAAGRSALGWAAVHGRAEVAAFLAPLGGIHAREKATGKDAAALARDRGYTEVAQLIEAHADKMALLAEPLGATAATPGAGGLRI